MLGIVLAQVLSILSAANPVAVEKESRMNEFLDYIDCSKNLSLRLKSRAIGAYSYYLDKMADVEATKSLRGSIAYSFSYLL